MHEIDMILKLGLEGSLDEAKAISDRLEELGEKKILDPRGNNTFDIWARHCFNRGWYLLRDNDYQKGSQLLEYGRYINSYGSGPLMTQAPIYNPETDDIKDKTLIISLEGGYGDEIIFARFVKSFKQLGAAKVYLAAAPELQSLFSRIQGCDGVILRNEAHKIAHDFWIPGFSAGWLAGHTVEDLPNQPYLTARQESVDIWSNFLKTDKKKVGIRWAGNPKFEHQQFRRFPENFMFNLSRYTDIQFYSLQRDHNTMAVPEGVIDLQHMLLSWEDTAAAIMNLDLVVTSCTAIAHLSAALGKDTWVVVPILPYNTWAFGAPHTTTSPYYNNVRVFRQNEFKKWNGVFQQLYTAFEEKFELDHQEMPNEDYSAKKLNLGCGLNRFDDFINIDSDQSVNPDQVVDLEQLPWPFKDNEVSHIVAKDILEHLGETGDEFIKILKEMYRVSENGAIWEVMVPHWRCDLAIDDPTHRRLITLGTFKMFNQKLLKERLMTHGADSRFAFDEGIDIEVCDVNFDFLPHWQEMLRKGEINEDQLNFALNTYNNVASSMRVLIQVHKPGRVTKQEVEQLLKEPIATNQIERNQGQPDVIDVHTKEVYNETASTPLQLR